MRTAQRIGQARLLDEARCRGICDSDETLGFGKHSHRTYQWVREHDHNYCDWAKQIENPNNGLSDLVNFIAFWENIIMYIVFTICNITHLYDKSQKPEITGTGTVVCDGDEKLNHMSLIQTSNFAELIIKFN